MKSKWKTFLLNDFAESIRGVSYKPHELLKGYECDAVTLLRSTNIQNHVLTFNELQFVPRTIVGEKQLCKYKDIIMCMSNGSKALVGKTAQFKFESQNFTCGSFCSILRSHEEKNANFVFVLVNSDSFLKQLDVTLSGSAINNLQNSQVDKFSFVLPEEIQEQQHIADILTSCDEVIEQTEKAIAKYQAIKTGMLQDLFTRGVDANGKLRPTPEEAPELYKDSPLGKIPNEWDIQSLGEITTKVGSGITPTGGESVYKKSGIMFLRSQNILRNEFDLADVAYIDEATDNKMLNSRVFFADVLLNITGASIGRCVCFDMEKSANVNQHVCIIRLADNDIYNAKLLSQFINSEWGISQINRLISGGNREGLNYEQVRAILFFNIPDNNDECKQILFRLSAIDEKISFEKQTLKKYISIKQGLMKRLLTPPEGALEA